MRIIKRYQEEKPGYLKDSDETFTFLKQETPQRALKYL